MRTTVTLDPDVERLIPDAMKERAISFKEALNEAARIGLRGKERKFIGKLDRKSTRLNSSHQIISYAVFCLKKKKKEERERHDHSLIEHPASELKQRRTR